MRYDRKILVHVLVYHRPNDDSSCLCGWAVLGASHPEHVADVYEKTMREARTDGASIW